MTVTLPDSLGATVQLADLRPLGVRLEDGGAESETHRAAEVGLGDLGHEDDDRVRSGLQELGRVGT